MRLAQLRKGLLIRLRLTLRAAFGCLSPFGRFQGVQIVGDRAVKARLRAVVRRDRDGDVFRMDIESAEQYFFIMVCLLCIGLLTGDTALAVLPPLRQRPVLPDNPRLRHSFKHTNFLFRIRCAPSVGSDKV